MAATNKPPSAAAQKRAAQEALYQKHAKALGFSDETRSYTGGTRPFSISAETRRGEKGFRTTDMRTGRSIRTGTKREATQVAKSIERHWLKGK